MGYDIDKPWRDSTKKERDWLLFTEEQPTVPVHAGLSPEQTRVARGQGTGPRCQSTFTGARRYGLETFSNTKSALMKKRVSRYLIDRDCPDCARQIFEHLKGALSDTPRELKLFVTEIARSWDRCGNEAGLKGLEAVVPRG